MSLQRRFWRSTRSIRWNGRIGIVLIALLLLITILGVLIVFSLNRLTLASNNLNRVVINLSDQSLNEITLDDIETLDEALEDVNQYVSYSRLFIMPIRPFARLYPDWRASIQRLDIAYELGLASSEMLDGAQSALYFLIANEDASVSTGITSSARVIELLVFGTINFEAAAEHLTQANTLLNAIQLGRTSDQQILAYQEINSIYEQLERANSALLGSPILMREMLGIDDETNYLVLAQNNDEIRPSGGFIGSYGWMSIVNGHITDFNYSASTESNPALPPESFAESFDVPDWWIRYENPIYAAWDGSWYVDFSETAQLAIDFYNAGENEGAPIEAAIAIDITGFEILLNVLEEVFVHEYGVTVNAENFRDVIYDIRAGGQSVDEHKIFLGDVYRAIQAQWSALAPDELPELIEALLSALRQKHIILYYSNPDAQAVVDILNWGVDQLAPEGSDYLLVVDANLSGNKSNNSIQRSISYDVNLLEDGSAEQRLGIQYDYLDRIAQNDPAVNPIYHGPLFYLNRAQIFTPSTSQIRERNVNLPETIALDDYTQNIANIQVDYESTQRYVMSYQTPDLVVTTGNLNHYQLVIQKQAGARPQMLDVRLTLPENAELIYTSPETEAIYESSQVAIEFLLEQTSDLKIDVIYRNR